MAEFRRIKVADIAVPDRLRAVEEEHAIAIAQSIVEHGLINPISVRSTPASKAGAYTLVAGAHRLRAIVLNDEAEIDAVVVEADKAEAQLMEITENLFRNDLSVIDRAVFVATYREVWQQKHGTIRSGPRNQAQREPNSSTSVVDLIAAEAEAGFAQHVADRLGISKASAKRLDQIARHLHPDMRAATRGTPLADNQSALLKLAKMEPAKQRKVAVAIRAEGPNLPKALTLVEGQRPKTDPQMAIFSSLVDAWSRANSDTRARFLAEVTAAVGQEQAA
ncbi:MAG TPA: ParB/RepB/Spo0J family partition protein [Mesorhizobium sp.]|jgi:ParB family chromosome partitioning protein|uniref:ParB/RepB/Spo0J family partition protein n=1 Tax=Mesorhizobium sp. TaxID=1871066 RepID=UPI002DDD5B5F|nr:ParB/RepB/Spo0J family partition protein [Mesorhizobium sp.]HEV2501641.1 ParB/RepB/Spo0J family partition protein [Mesorhizobium sp.]